MSRYPKRYECLVNLVAQSFHLEYITRSAEQELKNLEKNLTSKENRKVYGQHKNESETIYDHIVDIIRIRSKCERYEHDEKSTKFFLNLGKK